MYWSIQNSNGRGDISRANFDAAVSLFQNENSACPEKSHCHESGFMAGIIHSFHKLVMMQQGGGGLQIVYKYADDFIHNPDIYKFYTSEFS